MSYARILLATDGSPTVRPAIERAAEMASLLGSSLSALYVVDQASFALLPPQSDWQRVGEAMRAEGERALAEARDIAAQHGVDVAPLLEEGHPATRIAEVARDFDLVVMGTLGRSGIAHLLLGSVAEQVIRHAPCPVLVVRARA